MLKHILPVCVCTVSVNIPLTDGYGTYQASEGRRAFCLAVDIAVPTAPFLVVLLWSFFI
jgi:hypothetical protein